MGLSRALFAGISGLKGQQVKLDIIGNNIANVNTAGFKKSRVTFADLFSDTVTEGNSPTDRVGGKNPSQVGLGTAQPTIEQIFTEGPTQASGVATDLSISGNGFFVLGDDSKKVYTRDGNFKLDSNGDMVNSTANLRVQGWMADRDSDGSFTVDTSKTLESINIQENRKQFAKATDRIDYSSNLNSGSHTRDIEQSESSLLFRDNSSTDSAKQVQQKITWGFVKVDANNYQWSASDSIGNNIASGTLRFNDFGEILDSQVFPGGNTEVNYDPTDPVFQDILTTSGSGQIDPNGLNTNRPDNIADMVMDPNAPDFLNLTNAATPRAFSFTYDPDGAFNPGTWSDPHGISDLSQSTQNLGIAPLGNNTGKPTVANLAPSIYSITDIRINNSLANDKAGLSLQNYAGLDDGQGQPELISNSGQIRVSIAPDPGGANLMTVQVWKDYLGSVDPSTGGPSVPVVIGEISGLDRAQTEHEIAVPGVMQMKLYKQDAKVNPWQDSAANSVAAGPGPDFYFNAGSSGKLDPINDGQFFTGLPSGYHDGAQGPSKFEVRNVSAENSEYTGDLRIVFNAPTSFNVIDDQNVILTQGALRDGETDTEVEVAGIKFSLHREGTALTPRDLDDEGFLGTEIRLTSFRAAEGKAGPVTVNVPRISQVNDKTGQITKSETEITFNAGFSEATPVARQGFNTINPGDSLESLNNTFPTGRVTIDTSRARDAAVGNYRIEFGTRVDHSAAAGFDPYRPHNDPTTAGGATPVGKLPVLDGNGNPVEGGEDLNNQVLRVYVNGESHPRYVVDLNPGDEANGNTAEMQDINGQSQLSANFVPPYNFFASMQNYTPALGNANALSAANLSPTFNHQYLSVKRQITLPNGVVINVSNIDQSLKVGTKGGTAFNQSANFLPGDSFTFDVTDVGKGGLEEVGTYSASFRQGAQHSTSIEVFDSLGGSHILTTTYEHTDKNTGEWNYYLTLDEEDPLIRDFLNNPPAGFTVGDPENPTDQELRKANEIVINQGRQGKVLFNEDGSLDLFNSTIPNVKFKPADANEVEVKLNMDLVTQFESEFGTAARFRTGNAMGLLEGFSIESDGAILGSFSNGSKIKIAQMAMATFNNSSGLIKQGNNTFNSSTNSGIPRYGVPGTDDRGLLNSGVLEGSNVDLTEEFTELIVTQRSFTANGRIITTSDEFLQEILQLKR